MADNEIRINLIGYNENGFVGFMTGGKELTYLEAPKNYEEIIKKFNLPYISHDQVKDVNKFVEEHPESVDLSIVELKGDKNEKKSKRNSSGVRRKARKDRV